MSAPATPDLPQAWQYSFDFEGDHCSRGADFVVDELADDVLPEPLRTEIRALSDEDARTRLADLAVAAAADDEDDRADALREAAAALDYCTYSCDCAADAWSCESDYVDELLTGLGDHVWSVAEDDSWRRARVTYPDQGEVGVDSLFALISRRDGWSQLKAAWDGTALTVTFAGRSIGPTTLVCTPLTSELHRRAHEMWADFDPFNEEIASAIVVAEPEMLAAAVRLWTSIEAPQEVFTDLGALLAALTSAPADTLDVAALDVTTLEVARSLADDWESSLADLLAVSATVRSPAGCAFAAA